MFMHLRRLATQSEGESRPLFINSRENTEPKILGIASLWRVLLTMLLILAFCLSVFLVVLESGDLSFEDVLFYEMSHHIIQPSLKPSIYVVKQTGFISLGQLEIIMLTYQSVCDELYSWHRLWGDWWGLFAPSFTMEKVRLILRLMWTSLWGISTNKNETSNGRHYCSDQHNSN